MCRVEGAARGWRGRWRRRRRRRCGPWRWGWAIPDHAQIGEHYIRGRQVAVGILPREEQVDVGKASGAIACRQHQHTTSLNTSSTTTPPAATPASLPQYRLQHRQHHHTTSRNTSSTTGYIAVRGCWVAISQASGAPCHTRSFRTSELHAPFSHVMSSHHIISHLRVACAVQPCHVILGLPE